MNKIDKSIQFLNDNMTMLYSLCSKDEKKDELPNYILKAMKTYRTNNLAEKVEVRE